MAWYWPFGRKEETVDATETTPAWLRRQRRGYAAAGVGRTLADWIASTTSQDSETKSSLRLLRNRARQMERDNDYVRNALRIITNNVIGTGVNMQAQIRGRRGPGAGNLSTDQNSFVEQEWKKWKRADSCHAAGTMSFSEIERLVVRSVARDGEVFIRLIPQRFGRSKVPFALELIEPDQLDESFSGVATNGNEIRMGVEIDRWQRPVAYHFYTQHPGDLDAGGRQGTGQRRIRVPADEVIHLFVADRVGQTRGVPWFATALIRLRHMSGYEEAEVIAARASACQMGFIESPDLDHEYDQGDMADYDRVEDFEPGKIKSLAPGEKFTSHNPTRPSGLLDPFMRYMLRGVASGLGVSYESLSRDYSQSNYSSSRLALLDDRDTWKVLQGWIIERFHQRVHERFIAMGVLGGVFNFPGYELDAERYTTPRWIPRGWSWIDPSKEVTATKAAVRAGFMTMADAVAQAGGDFEELVSARVRELELCEANDLVFDTDPKVLDSSGKAQPNDPTEPPEPSDAAAVAQDSADATAGKNSNE